MLVESTSLIKTRIRFESGRPHLIQIHDGVWSMGNSRKTTQLFWLRNLRRS